MKKLLLVALLACCTVSLLNAQTFVSKDPTPRNVVLEEYTGIHCTYCPDGHKRAQALADANPGRVVLINVHAGGYATPGAGEPDFRTAYGDAFVTMSGLGGFPAGSINRQYFPGAANAAPYTPQKAGSMALSRGGWDAAAKDSILNGSISPVNVAAATSWDKDSRELKVTVEVFFTSTMADQQLLNVAFLESGVWGPQTGAPDPTHYQHNHILRNLLTGQWGESIATTTQGTFFTKTYSYIVPSNFVIDNCDIAVFVTGSNHTRIATGALTSAIPPASVTATLEGAEFAASVTNSNVSKKVTLKNTSNQSINLELSFDKSATTPADWSASIEGIPGLIMPVSKLTLAANETKDITVKFTQGATAGVGQATLTINQIGTIVTKAVTTTFSVATTNTKYLEVNGGGSINANVLAVRPTAYTIDSKYFSPNTTLFDQLKLVVWNTGAKGGLTTADADVLAGLINNGVGVFINGSVGIPMLTFDNPSHSLLDLLGATWISGSDIQKDVVSFAGVAGDPISDGLSYPSMSRTPNAYYVEPMSITNSARTKAFIMCTDVNQPVSIRATNGSKRSIYLSFNIEMITDTQKRNDLLNKCLNWIEGTTDVIDANTNDVTIYPNPASSEIRFNSDSYQGQDYSIYSVMGQKMLSGVNASNSIDINSLPAGCYSIRIKNASYTFVKN